MRLSADLRYEGRGIWEVLTTFTYPSRYGIVVVRQGFKTDLASVPRLPLVYLFSNDRAVVSAVIHDALYRAPSVYPVPGDMPLSPDMPAAVLAIRLGERRLSRHKSDRVFKDAMVDERVKRRYRIPIYYGVRAGGWLPWGRYREQEKNRRDQP